MKVAVIGLEDLVYNVAITLAEKVLKFWLLIVMNRL